MPHPTWVVYTPPGRDEPRVRLEHDCLGEAYSWVFGADPRWTITSVEPLTITPSIGCSRCGLHGFIRDGHWIPA